MPPVFPVEALSASFTTSSTYSQQTAAAYAARIVRLVCVLVGVSCQTPRVWNSKWKAKCAFIYLYLTSQVNNSLESGTEGGGGDGYKDETSVCVFLSLSIISTFLTFMVTAHRSVKFSI